MRKFMFLGLLTLSLAAAGVFAFSDAPRESVASPEAGTSYQCPLTGENLPCPACCPRESMASPAE
jgi:hypothetical protein